LVSSTDADAKLTTKIYRRLDELKDIADRWDDLVWGTGQPPALSYAWVASNLEWGQLRDRDWACFAAFDRDQLVGVLPVMFEKQVIAGRPRSLVTAPRDPHTPVAGLVTEPGRESEVAAAIVMAIRAEVPDGFGMEFIQVPSSCGFAAITRPRLGDSILLKTNGGSASYLPTCGRIDDVYGSLSRNVRRRLKKDRKKLGELPDVVFEFLIGKAATPDLLERFATVEAAGWKGRSASAIISSDRLMGFYRALVERLYHRGALEWHFLSSGGRTIAGHLVIRSGQTLTLKKIGYDEAFSRCSPGVMLLEEAIKRAFAREDVYGIDLVTDRAWHDNWPVEKRPYFDVWLYPRRPLPILLGVLPKKARWMLRRVPGLQSLVRRVRPGDGGQDQ